MAKPKVLYISQEITPYLPENPLSTLGRSLSQATHEGGYEVRTFMPKYGCINERRNQLHEVIRLSGLNLSINDNDHPLIIKVATLQPTRMQVYFIDSEDYFQFSPDKRLETVSSPDDNDERTIFFSRGVIETAKKLRWEPAIVHCMGWITSLIPMYLRAQHSDDPTFANSKIVVALRPEMPDEDLQAELADKIMEIGIAPEVVSLLSQRTVDGMTLAKFAIDHADAVTVAHPDVPQELIDYARLTGKPMLDYPGNDDSLAEAYKTFYKDLLD